MLLQPDELTEKIKSPQGRAYFDKLYHDDYLSQEKRYTDAFQKFHELYGPRSRAIFSSPGKIELCGSHIDRQNGRVLTAAVCDDIIAVAAPNSTGIVNIYSEGLPTIPPVALHELDPQEEEKTQPVSLIRGVAARLASLGYNVAGFDCYTISDLPGRGLSSSSAFVVLLGKIFSTFFNDNKISQIELAETSRFVEESYYGKKSEVAGPLTTTFGGIQLFDFKDPRSPEIIKCNYPEWDYTFCVVSTGDDSTEISENNLIDDEMTSVANFFGKQTMRDVPFDDFFSRLLEIKLPQRNILRAMHFFSENERVLQAATALMNNDPDTFCYAMRDSRRSSLLMLQNVFSPTSDTDERGLSLALAISDTILGRQGATRIHSDGFSGAISAFVPKAKYPEYQSTMNRIFGDNACRTIYPRDVGVCEFL